MSGLAWTFAGLLVAVVALLGAALFFAISRIDHLGVRLDGRIDETNRRIDGLHPAVLSIAPSWAVSSATSTAASRRPATDALGVSA